MRTLYLVGVAGEGDPVDCPLNPRFPVLVRFSEKDARDLAAEQLAKHSETEFLVVEGSCTVAGIYRNVPAEQAAG